MKFKKWMKVIDPIVDVVIWTQDDDKEPAYKGSLLDVPWYYIDWQIGNKDNDIDPPIYISKDDETGNPVIVVNLIAE